MTIKDVKRISLDLRPLTIDDLGLVATIQGHIQRFEAQHGIPCECQIAICERDIPEQMKIVVYRVLQEALANVAKHSRAGKAIVRLQKEHSEITLMVRDDGGGFNPDAPDPKDPLSGYGLKSMRERVEICQGDFSIQSGPGLGTTIQARFFPTQAKL